MDIDFTATLDQYTRKAGYTPTQLARLSGIPKRTIQNWLQGLVRRPRSWQDLVQLARVLHLDETETTKLLRSAGHPSVEELLAKSEGLQDELLSPWADGTRHGPERAPFQAIADFPNFVGREHELQVLRKTLLNGHQVTLYSFQGMGGVGKTTLAAHIVYELRPHFPDGVLWARVDTSDTMSILSTFADAYGRDVSTYTDVESRSRVVRGLLADKRVLIVLDNVQSSEQVSPLLPPSGTCAVIVTTRRHDLSVTRAAHKFLITSFSQEKGEALDLFAKILGQDVVESERTTLTEIADLLGHLPLALDIAACRMAYEPDWSMLGFLERLRQEQRRLDELAYEDQNVRLSFNVSYEALSEKQRRFFSSLGVFGGEDFSVEAAAYVAKIRWQEAEDNLRALYSLSLVQRGRSGTPQRYRLHPLLRDYAREKLQGNSAHERMVTYFVYYTESHKEDYAALDPERDNILAALEAAFKWKMWSELVRGANAFYPFLDMRGLHVLAEMHSSRAERAIRSRNDISNLVTMRDLATTLHNLGKTAVHRGDYDQAESYYREGLEEAYKSEHGESVRAILKGLGTVAFYRGDFSQAKAFWQQGLVLAREANDRRDEGAFLGNFGSVYYVLRQLEAEKDHLGAIEYLRQALAIAREIGDRSNEGMNLGNLGLACGALGQTERAIEYHEQALATFREIGDCREGMSLSHLGNAYSTLGQIRRAIEYHEQALAIAREIGDRRREGIGLGNLGNAYRTLGQVEKAIEYHEQALAISREISDRRGEGDDLNNLGDAYCDLGQVEKAIEYHEQALVIAREIGDRRGEGIGLGNLGNAYRTLGRLKAEAPNSLDKPCSRAAEYYEQALTIAHEIGDRKRQVEWLNGLGLVHHSLKQIKQAIAYCEQALAVAREIGFRQGEAEACWALGLLHEESDPPCAAELMQVRIDYRREIGHTDAETDAKRVKHCWRER